MPERTVIPVDATFQSRAATILNDLYDDALCDPHQFDGCLIAPCIEHVLAYPRKTMKYILLTQLLGKATDERVNIFSMHQSNDLECAWSARSLCEKVITRSGFEAQSLSNILGGSKQPYNNGVGQNHVLAKEGMKIMSSDEPIRDELVDALSTVETSGDARAALGYALSVCLRQVKELVVGPEEPDYPDLIATDLGRLARLLKSIARRGTGGEGLNLAVAAALRLALAGDDSMQVNLYQSNTSRRKSGYQADLEVYYCNLPFAAVELKDKPFTSDDVEKAASDARDGGFGRFAFVFGYGAGAAPNITISRPFMDGCVDSGRFVTCLGVDSLVDALLLLTPSFTPRAVVETLNDLIEGARVNPQTVSVTREELRAFLSAQEGSSL